MIVREDLTKKVGMIDSCIKKDFEWFFYLFSVKTLMLFDNVVDSELTKLLPTETNTTTDMEVEEESKSEW